MNRVDFDTYCRSLKATTNAEQWGGATVWKIGGKIFAICSRWGEGSADRISFKCSDLTYTILCEQSDIVPAPYLARAKWVQINNPEAMSDDDVRTYIEAAYHIIMAKLTRAKRAELGIELPVRALRL